MAKSVSADAIVGLEDSAHAGRVGKLDPKADFEAPKLTPEQLANETDEERWARMDSDAHMSVYLVHEGKWQHAAYHIGTAVASSPILTLPYQVSLLGWPGGMIALLVGGLITFYTTRLLADMHEYGGHRRNRYRDIGKAVYGRKGVLMVAPFQFAVLILTGFQVVLLGGQCLKAVYQLYTPEDQQHVQTYQWTIIYGVVYICFANIPNFHDSRWFNFSTNVATVLFVIIAIAMSAHTGRQNRLPGSGADPVDYGVHGSVAHKYFGIFAGIAGMALAYGDTVQPEIQSTLRSPSIPKMKQATWGAYAFIMGVMFPTAITGYWAFGNGTSVYVLGSCSGPKWVLAVAWVLTAYQNMGTSLVYCQPIFELASSRMSDPTKSVWSMRNFAPRFMFRVGYIVLTAFVGVLFPFIGDIITLSGSVAFLPLDYVIPFILANKALKPPLWKKTIHYIIASIYAFIGLMGAVAAIRAIVIDTAIYSVFANTSLVDYTAFSDPSDATS